MSRPKVVITMPAYQAARTLEKTVADVPAGVADEIILVDDASADNTVELARGLGLRVFVHPSNRGYGGNQKTCYTKALQEGADIVVLLHPDYQYDARAVPLLIAPILAGHADMTFGSRFAALGDPRGGGMPMYRYLGNRVTTITENLLLGSRFTEMHSGMRAYSRRCLLSLPFLSYDDGFVFDSQLLVDAATSGMRVVEVPIMTRYTRESSSISVLRSLAYVAGSVAYAGRAAAARGRRGRRWPVGRRTLRRGRPLGRGSVADHRCVLCRGRDHTLVHPANVERRPGPSDFACTSEAVGEHDDIVQCRRCGMVSSRPSLELEEIATTYEDVVDEGYLSEEAGRRELFGWIVDRTEGYPVAGRRLLELGAHVGLFLDVAARRGWQARGVEPSKWAVDLGRERFGVDLRQGTAEEVEEPDRSADVVVMLDVLEHLVDPLAALRRIRPVLDDEGLLVLATVNVRSLHARARGERWPWFILPHLHYFSPETLHATLARAGFRVVDWSVAPRSFHLSYLARRGGENLGALGRAAEAVSRVADLRIPVGWLGDVVLVVARADASP